MYLAVFWFFSCDRARSQEDLVFFYLFVLLYYAATPTSGIGSASPTAGTPLGQPTPLPKTKLDVPTSHRTAKNASVLSDDDESKLSPDYVTASPSDDDWKSRPLKPTASYITCSPWSSTSPDVAGTGYTGTSKSATSDSLSVLPVDFALQGMYAVLEIPTGHHPSVRHVRRVQSATPTRRRKSKSPAVDISSDSDNPSTPKHKSVRKPKTVLPKQPLAHAGARLVDASYFTASEKARSLQLSLKHVMKHGFLVWSDNMCHFDTYAIIQLACWSILGAGYWETGSEKSVDRLPLARNERFLLDLLCSAAHQTPAQLAYLRLAYMWNVLEPTCTFGQPMDLMLHAWSAPDGLLNVYHSEHRQLSCTYTVECKCSGHREDMLSRVDGSLRVLQRVCHDDKDWECADIQSAICHSLLRDTNYDLECRSCIKGFARSKCGGRFRYAPTLITLGSLLCVHIDSPFKPRLSMRVSILDNHYFLVGVGLHTGAHYVARFRTSIEHEAVWYDYNDIPTGSIVPTTENALCNPATYNGKTVFVRGAWYVHESGNGKPVTIDHEALLQSMTFDFHEE